MVRRSLVVAATIASLAVPLPVARAAEGMPPCPADGYQPLGDPYTGPGLSILFPPLAIALAAARDKLADEARREMTFRAIDAAGNRVEGAHIALLWEGKRHIGETMQDGRLDLPDGVYTVVAAIEGEPARWGSRRIDTRGKGDAPGPSEFEVRIDRTLPAIGAKPASDLSSDGRAAAGGFARFAWSGPRQADAGLAVVPRGVEGGKALREAKVGGGVSSTVEMPASQGSYDVRLLLCAPRMTLALWPVEVGPAAVTLSLPDKVKAGQAFEVTAGGRIGAAFSLAVVEGGSEREIVSEKAERAKPRVKLVAPLKAGTWDVVYRSDDDDETVLARRRLTVEAGTIEIKAPAEVRLGAPVAIAYTGSENGGGGELELWTKAGVQLSDGLTLNGGRLPAPAGEHELRLVDRADRATVLARRSIRVVGSMLGAPDTVAPSATVPVTFTEAPAFFDVVRIVPRGHVPVRFEDGAKVDPDQERSVKITAPATAGDWDVVLVDESPGMHPTVVIDRRPLTIR